MIVGLLFDCIRPPLRIVMRLKPPSALTLMSRSVRSAWRSRLAPSVAVAVPRLRIDVPSLAATASVPPAEVT